MYNLKYPKRWNPCMLNQLPIQIHVSKWNPKVSPAKSNSFDANQLACSHVLKSLNILFLEYEMQEMEA